MKKKEYSDDDGRTIVDMNVEGFRWYESESQQEGKKAYARRTPKEKKALRRATWFSVALPLVCLLIGVSAAFFLLYFLWL